MDTYVLITKSLQGDYEASEQLLTSYYDDLVNFFYNSTGNKNTAWNLTEKTLSILFTELHNFKQTESNFKPWIYRFAINVLFEYYETRMHKQQLVEFILEDYKISSDIIEDYEIKNTLKYLETLKPIYRKILLLSYYTDFNISKISYILDIPKNKTSDIKTQAIFSYKNNLTIRKGSLEIQ